MTSGHPPLYSMTLRHPWHEGFSKRTIRERAHVIVLRFESIMVRISQTNSHVTSQHINMADKEDDFNFIRRSLFYLFVILVFQFANCSLVAEFESNKPFSRTDLLNAHRLTKRDTNSVDEKCTSQENTFLANVKTDKIDQTVSMQNTILCIAYVSYLN